VWIVKKLILTLVLILFVVFLLSACAKPVTLFTDADKPSVQKLTEPFTRQTGIPVAVVRFSDARELASAIAKYSGSEYERMKNEAFYHYADVVFCADIAAGEALKARGALQQYTPTTAAGIPAGAKADGWWYGTGGFVWVLAWNTDLVKDGPPTRLLDLASDAWPDGAVAMINPNYMLYYSAGACAILGQDRLADFFNTLMRKDTHWEANPAQTAALVAAGDAKVGLTTLKEAQAQKNGGAHIGWAVPDQESGGAGAYVQYNVVCLCTTATMPNEAKLLEDYLLDPQTEALGVQLGLGDATMRPCPADAPVVTPLRTDLAGAQRAMQGGFGNILTYFTFLNPQYQGK
jgi:ABC-type Fe3+ transport system substrate-binding protein